MPGKPEGIIALADAIKNNRALLSLTMDNTALALRGCKALCEGLRSNSVITSLSLSKNCFGARSAAIIAGTIPTMGALTSLNVSDNKLGGYYEGYLNDGRGYGSFTATPEGPEIIADAISKCK